MKSTIIAIAALAATVAADSVGQAIVVNKCSSDVYLQNTPSDDGVHTEVDKTLKTGDSYSQTYTQLANNMGWSLKLSNSTSMDNIMQYEYTFLDDGVIWYDMSNVNGNPWDGNWLFTSDDSTCKPTHGAYQYSTDDANGMQASCDQSASITVTLCAQDDNSDGSDVSSSASSAVYSTTAPASSAAASSAAVSTSAASSPAPSTTSTAAKATSSAVESAWNGKPWAAGKAVVISTPTTAAAPTTTLVTSVVTSAATSTEGDVVWVTDVAYVTEYVTAASKRDVHHHQHHARHPHGGRA